MNIILITQGISRVVQPLLESEHNILAIVESAPRRYAASPKRFEIFQKIVNLRNSLKPSPACLKELCEKDNIPYRFMASSKDPGLEDWIKSFAPNLIVVFSMSQLLRENIFHIPTHGTINLHPSFLPEYRGPNPDFWQYYDQVLDPGVTVHYVDAGEDTGDVIFQERVPFPLGTKSPDRLDHLIGGAGVRLLLNAIDAIAKGFVEPKSQPSESPTVRARNIKKEEHKKIINWDKWPIERIWHVMRGTELWLDCIKQPSGLYRGQRWVVGDYRKTKSPNRSTKGGEVKRDSDGYFVCCRDGAIRLQRVFYLKNLLRFAYRSLLS